MKKSVFMLMVATALASCSQTDLTNPQLEGDDVIRLKSTMLTAGATTRAPFTGAIGAANKLTALVPSATASGSYEDDLHTVTGTMTFDGSGAVGYDAESLALTSEARFPNGSADDDDLFLFGLYPATGWTIETGGDKATITFTGKEDVVATEEISTTKAEVKAANIGTGSFKSLEFNHLLTKLEVQFKASATALTEIGSIKSVELVSSDAIQTTLPNQVTYDPVNNTPDFTGGTPVATMPFYGATTGNYTHTAYTNQSYQPGTTATLQAYCLAAPVSASASPAAYEYYIRIVTNGGASAASTKILPIDLNDDQGARFSKNTAGYAFNIIVNYTVDDIYVTATVADWKQGGDTTVPGI